MLAPADRLGAAAHGSAAHVVLLVGRRHFTQLHLVVVVVVVGRSPRREEDTDGEGGEEMWSPFCGARTAAARRTINFRADDAIAGESLVPAELTYPGLCT